ncbi:hypothetical protein ZRA01_33290 [Zoogloea ramigera]|uniref:Uncharacterized protein n=1 Tax=Zoogloea ramigera TaxID=350 RepID=A0A4Y4CY70_ZOORA|nr:hypothetical protein ZRA01_33290 [Zoogloea ramigera]
MVKPRITDEFGKRTRECAEISIDGRERELIPTSFAPGQQLPTPQSQSTGSMGCSRLRSAHKLTDPVCECRSLHTAD